MKSKSKARTKLKLTDTMMNRLTAGELNGTEIASLCGISRQRACLLLRQGRSALEIVESRIASSGKPMTRQLDRVNGAASDSAAEVETRSLAQLQRDKLAAAIARIRLDIDLRGGQLIPRADVQALVEHVVAVHRVAVRALLTLPRTLGDECEGRSAIEIAEIWNRQLRDLLEKLSAANRRALGRFGFKEPEPAEAAK